ncbi:glycosyltransferase family 2 protein [Microvirga sp. BT689]|uniref:glycosyltransferase family 2 protein n=1 Tax=Microvirga arvi TaxID=2778731 RepID=UPI0019529BD5|nr:glycosyltransferase family A protein [Microvirga arvi]MBM6582636.1 glycosyltransferase family 2 protein [Microvirga arvi]
MTETNRPKISVVIRAFQDAKHIDRAIESVLAQSFADFELIVVDDGSMDGTREAVAAFDAPQIVYVWQPHLGPSAALNRAIGHARGAYVAFLAAEDECLPDRLEFQLTSLEGGGFTSHFCAPSLIDEHGEELDDHAAPVFFKHDATDGAGAYRDFLNYGNFLCFSGAMVKREALERVGGFNPGLFRAHDFEQWIRLCKLGGMAISRERFVRHRVRRERSFPPGIRLGASSDSELAHVYEHFFDGVSVELLKAAFPDESHIWGDPLVDDPQGFATMLLLLHPSPSIREIAFRRLLNLFRDEGPSGPVMLSNFEVDAPALATALRSHR